MHLATGSFCVNIQVSLEEPKPDSVDTCFIPVGVNPTDIRKHYICVFKLINSKVHTTERQSVHLKLHLYVKIITTNKLQVMDASKKKRKMY